MKRKLWRLAAISYRQARKIVVFIIGGTIVLVGVALIVLPGPAFIVIPIGLGVLAIEFAWARRWLRKMKDAANDGVTYLRNWTGGEQSKIADTPATPSDAAQAGSDSLDRQHDLIQPDAADRRCAGGAELEPHRDDV